MPQFERPDTPLEKIATGALAMFVPRAVGQGLGLITIGGGRGLWLFADLDTLVLDVIVIVALVLVSRQIAAGRQPQPVFWAVLSVTLMMAVSLAYQGSNFGTLFRQRGMVALGLMLLPLLTGPEGGRRTPDATVRT